MANAAALLVGLALIWLSWAPQALERYWLIAGAVGVGLSFVLALAMRGADGEGAPYARAPMAALRAARDSGRIVSAAFDVARRAIAGDSMLNPALIRLKTRASDDAGRAAFAGAVARAPDALVVNVEEDALLVHVLVEADANEAALRALERAPS